MKNKNKEIKKSENEKEHDIEIVIGDGSSLEISDVNDCMNSLRPNDLGKKKKTVIIPTEKKNVKNNKQKDSSIDKPANNDSNVEKSTNNDSTDNN